MAVRKKTPSWPSTTGTLPTSTPVPTGSDGERARDPVDAAEDEEDRPYGWRSDALPGDGLHRGDGPDNPGVRGHPLAILGPPEVGGGDRRSHPRLPLPGLPGSRGRPRPSGPLAPGQNPVRGVRWVRPVSRLLRGALDHPAHERRAGARGGGIGIGRTGDLGFSRSIGPELPGQSSRPRSQVTVGTRFPSPNRVIASANPNAARSRAVKPSASSQPASTSSLAWGTPASRAPGVCMARQNAQPLI